MFNNAAIAQTFRAKHAAIVTAKPKSAAVTKATVTAESENNHLKSVPCNDSGAAVTAVTMVTKAIVTDEKPDSLLESVTYRGGNDDNDGNGEKMHPGDSFFYSDMTLAELENYCECVPEREAIMIVDGGLSPEEAQSRANVICLEEVRRGRNN